MKLPLILLVTLHPQLNHPYHLETSLEERFLLVMWGSTYHFDHHFSHWQLVVLLLLSLVNILMSSLLYLYLLVVVALSQPLHCQKDRYHYFSACLYSSFSKVVNLCHYHLLVVSVLLSCVPFVSMVARYRHPFYFHQEERYCYQDYPRKLQIYQHLYFCLKLPLDLPIVLHLRPIHQILP